MKRVQTLLIAMNLMGGAGGFPSYLDPDARFVGAQPDDELPWQVRAIFEVPVRDKAVAPTKHQFHAYRSGQPIPDEQRWIGTVIDPVGELHIYGVVA